MQLLFKFVFNNYKKTDYLDHVLKKCDIKLGINATVGLWYA